MKNITQFELMQVSGQLRIDQDKDNAFWIEPSINHIGGKFNKQSHSSTKTFQTTSNVLTSSNGRVAFQDILKEERVDYCG